MMDIVLVLITIIIPIFVLEQHIQIDIYAVPLFLILFIFFIFLNSRAHKIYLDTDNQEIENNQNKNSKNSKNRIKTFKYIMILLITGVLLFFIGELLGNSLEILCNFFNIPETIIGILLGIITSVPELITFFESQRYYKQIKDEMLGVVEATNNLLTSNILNLFIIQTIGILITSI